MSKDAILKIRETEARAEEIVAKARKEAQELIESARAHGQALCNRAEEEGAAELARRLDETKKQNEAALRRSEREVLTEAEDLKGEAALRKKIAEKMVIRGLEDKCR